MRRLMKIVIDCRLVSVIHAGVGRALAGEAPLGESTDEDHSRMTAVAGPSPLEKKQT